MSIHRISGGYTPSDLTSEADAAQQQTAPAAHRHHHAPARQKRPSLRKRRSAESADANDPSAESEELLMMLDQHLRRDGKDALKVEARDSGGSQPGFGQDEHSSDTETSSKRSAAGGQRQNLTPRDLPMRFVERDARDESVLSRHWHAAAKGGDGGSDAPTLTRGAQAEVALARMRAAHALRDSELPSGTATNALRGASTLTAVSAKNSQHRAIEAAARASLTYQVLAIVREFLQMPDDSRTSRPTLARVRDRLVSTVTSAVHGASRHPPSPAEESMNLLMPLVLLNLGRNRTRAGRAMGISALAALIRRGRGW